MVIPMSVPSSSCATTAVTPDSYSSLRTRRRSHSSGDAITAEESNKKKKRNRVTFKDDPEGHEQEHHHHHHHHHQQQNQHEQQHSEDDDDDDDDDDDEENEEEEHETEVVVAEEEPDMIDILQEQICNPDQDMVATSLEQLADLCRLQDDENENTKAMAQRNYQLAMEQGCMELILFLMRQNPLHDGILMHGCCVLANLMCFDSKAEEYFGRLGGPGVILLALQSFPDNEPVQRTGLVALKNYLVDKTHRQQRLKNLVLQDNAIEIIVSAMRNHIDNVDIQRLACVTVSFCCEASYCDQIYKAKGYSTVVKTYNKFRTNPVIRNHAKLIIHMLQDYVNASF